VETMEGVVVAEVILDGRRPIVTLVSILVIGQAVVTVVIMGRVGQVLNIRVIGLSRIVQLGR